MTKKKKPSNRVDELLDELLEDHQTPEEILGESGLLKQLSKRLIERALSGELNHHLAWENQDQEELEWAEPKNRRNGYSQKTRQSDRGEMELSIPRDRQSNFEPILIPKNQRRIAGLDEKILKMYARGLSVRERVRTIRRALRCQSFCYFD